MHEGIVLTDIQYIEEKNLYEFIFSVSDSLQFFTIHTYDKLPFIKEYAEIEIQTSLFERIENIVDKQYILLINENCLNEENKNFNFLRINSEVSELNSWGSLLKKKIPLLKGKTLGICDARSTQNFASFENYSQKYNFTPIYGVETSMSFITDDIFDHIKNPNLRLKDMRFLVVDLETTGNLIQSDIIEIGYYFLDYDSIIPGESHWLREDNDLPISERLIDFLKMENIKQIIKISRKEYLERFFKLLEDENIVLISHRKFDIAYLNRASIQYFNKPLNCNYLDTFDLFRLAFKFNDISKFSLDNIAGYLNISVDFQNRHKALYDAYVTALSLKKVFDIFGWDKTILELKELRIPVEVEKDYKVLIYVTKQTGIQNLNILLSQADTERRNKRAVIPYQLFKKYNEGLLLLCPSADGELIESFLFGFNNLQKIIEKYDYISLDNSFNSILKECQFRQILNDFDDIKFSFNFFHQHLINLFNNKIIYNPKLNILTIQQMFGIFVSATIFNQGLNLQKNINDELLLKKLISDFCLTEKKYRNDEILNLNREAFLQEFAPIKINTFTIIDIKHEIDIFELLNTLGEKKYGKVWELFIPGDITLKEKAYQEIEKLKANNFDSIFLLVYLIISEVKEKYNTNFGSRGTVGSSFAAFILGITEINPLPAHYYCTSCGIIRFEAGIGIDLPDITCPSCNTFFKKNGFHIDFIMFSGFDAEKMPDIDLNLAAHLHSEVRHFILEKIKSFGLFPMFASAILKLQEKSARLYSVKFFTEKISTQARDKYFSHSSLRAVSNMLIGTKLTTSVHPGGIQIFNNQEECFKITSLQKIKNNEIVCHSDYSILKNVFKLDLLAHEDPASLQALLDATNIKEENIILNQDILNLFTQSKTVGLPEFGTKFVRSLLKNIPINKFEDLIKISGLTHGTNVWFDNGQKFFAEGIPFSEIIGCRDDIFHFLIKHIEDKRMCFQISEFIRKGGISLNSAKWDKYKEFLDNYELPEWFLESCSKMIYIFPRAHAAAYTFLCLKIAYFKLFFPKNFYQVYLNRKINYLESSIFFLEKKDKINYLLENAKEGAEQKRKVLEQILLIIDEMKQLNYKIELNLYHSEAEHFVFENDTFFIPLILIKNFGLPASKIITESRMDGEFSDFFSFKKRTNLLPNKIKLLVEIDLLPFSEPKQNTLF